MPVGRVDDVGLDLQIVAQELYRIRIVRQDAAHLGRGKKYELRLLLGEESFDRGLFAQIELAARVQQQLRITSGEQPANDRAADQASVTRDEDTRTLCHRAHS